MPRTWHRPLTIGFYAHAGLSLLFALAWVALIELIFGDDRYAPLPGQDPEEAARTAERYLSGRWFAFWLATIYALYFVVAARCFQKRRFWRFCVASAALAVPITPIGTSARVFALIHLFDPDVRAGFSKPHPVLRAAHKKRRTTNGVEELREKRNELGKSPGPGNPTTAVACYASSAK
jgi:hypothetical protein